MDFDELYEDTCTTISNLAREGNAEEIKVLINRGKATTGTDNRGWRPLHHAVARGHLDCVEVLLTADDVEIDATSHDDLCVLDLVSLINDPDVAVRVARLLFAAGANPNLFHDAEPYTICLNRCIKTKNLELIKVMLENGVDPNKGDEEDGLPLHLAANMGEIDIIKLLLEKNADFLSWGDQAVSILHSVLGSKNFQCLQFVLDHPLCTKEFINTRIDKSYTALMVACQLNWVEGGMELLKRGADPNVYSTTNISPLHLAIQFSPSTGPTILFDTLLRETKKDLLMSATSIDENRVSTSSIYHIAIYWERYQIVRDLVEASYPCDHFEQEALDALIDSQDRCKSPLVVPLDLKYDAPLAFLLSQPLTEETVSLAKFLVESGGSSIEPVREDFVPPLVECVKHRKLSYSKAKGCPGYTILKFLMDKGVNIMHKIANIPLPVALYVASLFNPKALFVLLNEGNINPEKIFIKDTFKALALQYIVAKYYTTYRDFYVTIISWLRVVNIFLPNLSPKDYCYLKKNHWEDQTPWRDLEETISTPKSLTDLSVLTIRRTMFESGKGRRSICESIKILQNESRMIPSRIIDLLMFEHINIDELISGLSKYLYVPEEPENSEMDEDWHDVTW